MSNKEVYTMLEHLSLQDCIIDEIQESGKNLTLILESVHVMADHPQNSFNVAKTAEEVRLTFTNYKISDVKRTDDDLSPVEIKFEDMVSDFEIFEVTYLRAFDKKKFYKFTGQCSFEHDSDFGEFVISFDSVSIEWDCLEDDAWFVDFED